MTEVAMELGTRPPGRRSSKLSWTTVLPLPALGEWMRSVTGFDWEPSNTVAGIAKLAGAEFMFELLASCLI